MPQKIRIKMKNFIFAILALLIIGAGVLYALNGSSNYDKRKYSLKIAPKGSNFSVDSTIDFTLPDQFDKTNKLEDTAERLIFVFTKDTGHIIKTFMADKKDSYLNDKKAVIVADISAMPVIIQNTFALPDLRQSNYKMMLIYDKSMAKRLKKGQDAKKIIVMTLKNKKVIDIQAVASAEELEKLL